LHLEENLNDDPTNVQAFEQSSKTSAMSVTISLTLQKIIKGLRDLRVEDSEKEKVSELFSELDNLIWLVEDSHRDELDSDERSDEILNCYLCEDGYDFRYTHGVFQIVDTGEMGAKAGYCTDCMRFTCHYHFGEDTRCTDPQQGCHEKLKARRDRDLDRYMNHPLGCECCECFVPFGDPVTDGEHIDALETEQRAAGLVENDESDDDASEIDMCMRSLMDSFKAWKQEKKKMQGGAKIV